MEILREELYTLKTIIQRCKSGCKQIYEGDIIEQKDTNIKNVNNDNAQAARYIDWKRGTPYIFSAKDIEELKKVKNTKYAFARKVTDSNIIKNVFN